MAIKAGCAAPVPSRSKVETVGPSATHVAEDSKALGKIPGQGTDDKLSSASLGDMNGLANILLSSNAQDNKTALRAHRIIEALKASKGEPASLGQLALGSRGRCRICDQTIMGTPTIKCNYVFTCTREGLVKAYIKAAAKEVGPLCPFGSCSSEPERCSPGKILSHIYNHTSKSNTCRVQGCQSKLCVVHHLNCS